jgi:IS5 family transposase
MLKFEEGNWAGDQESGLMDVILERNPKPIKTLEKDIALGQPDSTLGRQDSPGVEQIIRAAIYKEMKNLNYRELEYVREDSGIVEGKIFSIYERHTDIIVKGRGEAIKIRGPILNFV